jgi:hypothetical protein
MEHVLEDVKCKTLKHFTNISMWACNIVLSHVPACPSPCFTQKKNWSLTGPTVLVLQSSLKLTFFEFLFVCQEIAQEEQIGAGTTTTILLKVKEIRGRA